MHTAQDLPDSRAARPATPNVRCWALANPQSGTFAAQSAWFHCLESAGGRLCTTATDDELATALAEAQREGYNRLIVVGGDGSVSRVMNALGDATKTFELAVVPAGTGNDLARSLGIPLDDPEAAWKLALSGEAKPIDALALQGTAAVRLCLNGITGGFGGQQAASSASDQKSSLGRIAYWVSALSQLGDMAEYDVELQLDGGHQSIRALGFWILNGRSVGGGFSVSPTSLLDDGLFDVVVIPALPMLELLATGLDFTTLGPEQAEQVLSFRVSSMSVATRPAVPLSIDGEPVETDQLECKMLPQAFRMVAGPADPAFRSGAAAP